MRILLLSFLVLVCVTSSAQEWVKLISNPDKTFFDIQAAFNAEWENKEYVRSSGWKQFKRWEWRMESRTYPTGQRFPVSTAYAERQNFLAEYGQAISARSTGWTPMGPDSWNSISYNPGIGRVNVVREHPNNANIIYAGSPSGGLWKSIDAGQTWTPLTDHFSALGVSGIAIDYTNPDVIYISTGDMDGFDTYSIGVMKSLDGGATWQPTGLIHNLGQFVVCRKIEMHPTNPNILLVATSDGLFKTTDGGINWTEVASGSYRDIHYHPTNSAIVYVSSSRFYRSTDGGDSFVQISSGLPNPADVNRMEIAVSPDEPDWVYALCGDATNSTFLGLYRSIDGGVTFQLRANSPNLFGYSEIGDDSSGQSWFDMALDADPNDANTIVVGGINVWKSQNGGLDYSIISHWVYPSSIGYTHADIHTLDYINGKLFCGSDGGLFVSNDNGSSWSDLTPGMEITQFYRLGLSSQNADLVIAGAQDNGSNLLKNNQWTHVMGADGMEAAISPTNQNILFCTWQFGGIHRSTDGGDNWNYIFDGDGEDGAWVTPFVSLPGNVLIAGYENVWKSTNNGTTFTQISNFSSGSIRDIAVAKSNNDYIYISFNSTIHRTTNGGNNWQNITNNLPNLSITDIQVHPSNPDIVYVTFSGYNGANKVFVSVNGGGTWQNITNNLPNLPCNAIVFQEGSNGGLYVGMDVGVYYTDSTLSNWQAFDLDMPNVIVNELEIHYGAEKIRAATYGRGIWESDLFAPSSLPPTADFTQLEGTLCETDSLSFFDASTNASPGWTWYFPGGSPATSIASNPQVLYPSSGSYDVSLVVSNANGSDSIFKTIYVEIEENVLHFTLNTDNYPEETSWTIEDDNSVVVASGGGYGAANSIFESIHCLAYGCYTFTIYDTYGDGICCAYGTGSFELANDSGEIILSGGEFGSSQEIEFCVESEDPTIGLSNFDNETIVIFPNPTSEYFTITLPSPESYVLTLQDLTGKIILQQQVKSGEVVNISTIASGLYLLQAVSGNRKFNQPLIKVD
jgi:photosystem II stability/assembly factor-like uncharacterized protein